MAGVLRGELHWADLDPQGGLRPVLVLSQSVFNERSGTVIAVAITSSPQRAGFPLTVAVPPALLPKESWIKVSQMRTISTQRLRGRIAEAPPELVATVLEGLDEIIGT